MRRLLVPLRIVLSLGLLTFLIWRADLASIWQVWRGMDWRLFCIALVLQFAGVALSAAKWGVLLRTNQQHLPFSWLLGNYLAGQFANNFLPTTIGGDALRVTQLGRRIGSYSHASASVFMERLTGFLALSVIACFALLLSMLPGSPLTTAPWIRWVTAGFTALALGLLVVSFLAPQVQQRVERFLPARVREPFERVTLQIANYSPRGWQLALVMAMSFAFQLLWIFMHVVAGAALGIQAPLLVYGLMVPMTDILGLLPIFFNSLGVREAVFTLYLGQVGIPSDQAIALALLVFSIRLIISALGGLVLLFGGVDLTTTGTPVSPDT